MIQRCHTPRGHHWLHPTLLGLVAAGLSVTALAAEPKATAPVSPPDFSGTWHAEWCDKARPQADCGGFTVFLFQKGERLCGNHQGATANLSRLDEGQPRSVVGAVAGRKAVMTVHSTRASEAGTLFLAVAEHQGRALQWRVVDTVTGDGADHVVAQKATLRRKATDERNGGWQSARDACRKAFDGSAD